jgi:hypothetical protein
MASDLLNRPAMKTLLITLLLAGVLNAAQAESNTTADADLLKIKAAKVVELEKRLRDDKQLSETDRANIQKLVARLTAELKAAGIPPAAQAANR